MYTGWKKKTCKKEGKEMYTGWKKKTCKKEGKEKKDTM